MKTINEVDFLENQRFRKSTSRNWVVSNKITKVLNSVGFGWAQYRSIFVVGLAFLISSMDIVIVSILQNCVPMQWDTVSFKYNILTCSIFMGQILGLSFAGLLADNYGRKKCLLCGWGFKMLICFIPRYEESYVRVFMGRLLAGVAMGATQTIGYDLVAELLPTQKRGTALLILSICTSLGKFLITLICWVFLAEYGWSTVSFYTGVFILVPFVYGFFLLPESPLWLASKDKVEWAESVIDEMSSINGVQMEPVLIARATKKSTGIKPYRRLFGSKFRWRVANMSVVWFATSFAYICLIVQEGKTFQKGRYCNISYFEVVTLNAVELPGIIILYNLISKFPRGMIQSIFLGYSATFSVLRALTSMFTTTHSGNATLPEYVYLLAMKATLVAAIAALWIHTVELFPTEVRT
jgi:MFS family permease